MVIFIFFYFGSGKESRFLILTRLHPLEKLHFLKLQVRSTDSSSLLAVFGDRRDLGDRKYPGVHFYALARGALPLSCFTLYRAERTVDAFLGTE